MASSWIRKLNMFKNFWSENNLVSKKIMSRKFLVKDILIPKNAAKRTRRHVVKNSWANKFFKGQLEIWVWYCSAKPKNLSYAQLSKIKSQSVAKLSSAFPYLFLFSFCSIDVDLFSSSSSFMTSSTRKHLLGSNQWHSNLPTHITHDLTQLFDLHLQKNLLREGVLGIVSFHDIICHDVICRDQGFSSRRVVITRI